MCRSTDPSVVGCWMRCSMVSLLSQGPKKCSERPFFVLVQFEAADDIKEFHGVFERRQTTIMKIGRRILDASQHKGFDRPVRCSPKPLKMQIVHLVIGERR